MAKLNQDLLKQAGLTQEVIDKLIQEEERKDFEESIKSLFKNPKVKEVRTILKSFTKKSKVALKLSITTNLAGEDTLRIARASNIQSNGTNGGAKKPCIVNGIKYESCASACRTHGLEIGRNSPKRVLESALKNKSINSFELVE